MSSKGGQVDANSVPAVLADAPSSSPAPVTMRIAPWLAAFGGASCLGLFFGLLIGMSTSPVVASVVSALVGALATVGTTIVGRKRTRQTDPLEAVSVCAYLAGFSAFATIGLLAGVYERTHHVLAPTPAQVVQAWRDAGLPPEEAQQVALFLLAQMRVAPNTGTEPSRSEGRPAPDRTPLDPTAGEALAPPPHRETRGAQEADPDQPRQLERAESPDTIAVYPAGLVAGSANVCDDVVSALKRGNLSVAEHHARDAGGDWTKELQRNASLAPEARAGALSRFAASKCGRP